MDDAPEQHKKQYDWLKQYQWQKGQSGNPSGAKKGKKLKTFVSEMLEKMSEEDKAEFLKGLDPDLIWRMAEGNPKQDADITSAGEKIMILPSTLIEKNDTTPESGISSSGQA